MENSNSPAVNEDFDDICPIEECEKIYPNALMDGNEVIAQTFISLVCMLNDIFGTSTQNPKNFIFIRQFKDVLHASIGFPVSMFVGLTFWFLMLIDRELVLPKALDPYFPWWLNHLMHTVIMIFPLVEMIMAPRRFPARSTGLGVLAGFMILYLTWMHYIYYKSGAWAYPILEVLTWPARIGFYLMLLIVVIALYFAGEVLDKLVWTNQQPKDSNKHK